MSTSTDAILFFGFCWDEEGDIFADADEADDDWEDRYARLAGLVEPTETYPDKGIGHPDRFGENYTPEEALIIDRYRAFWSAKNDMIAALPVEIDRHCSGDCLMPFVCAKASKVTAWRGYPKEIESLEVKPEWEAELRSFCAYMGIDVSEKKCAWWMVSFWG